MTTLALSAAVASIAWTVTKEEVFREWRDFCERHKRHGPLWKRKLAYVWTCEYCFSHWVAFVVVGLTGHRLAFPGWQGMLVAIFTVVAVANVLMTAYQILRAGLRLVQGLADMAGK